MRAVVEQSVVETQRVEEFDKDKKKKRRSHRRSKNNPPSSASCNSVSELREASSSCFEQTTLSSNYSSKQHGSSMNSAYNLGQLKASDVAFNSMPTFSTNASVYPVQVQNMQTGGRAIYSDSCPESLASGVNSNHIYQRSHFTPHWSLDVVDEALGKGDILRALFHVNAHNRLEAYCKVDGVPADILVSGIAAQNRALEGDIVAIKIDPLSLWVRMKGSNGICNNSASLEDDLVPDNNDLVSDSCKDALGISFSIGNNRVANAVEKLCSLISSFPSKRPTGSVVAIIEKSPRRDAIVGFLNVKQWVSYRDYNKKDAKKKKNSVSDREYIQLTPLDPTFPKMTVLVRDLPDSIMKRLLASDLTVESDLVAAKVVNWDEESLVPEAYILEIFGHSGEVEPRINAILFESAISCSEFSPEALSCLPRVPWEVSCEELNSRMDLRNLCIFTIDPSTATDLDDALSIEILSDGIFRVGIHIADVSYFVLPDTPLDVEAWNRSTSVYMSQRKLPMLPPLLSENIGSLNPGEERLAFSIFLDINLAGDVLDRQIGRTVIRSCCKLSYEHAQDIIEGILDMGNYNVLGKDYPAVHGDFDWPDVITSVKSLFAISKNLKEKRFSDGALRLESSKIVFQFDKYGFPCDSMFCERKDSNFLIEEFMLLANRTAAEVICKAFPDNALLRRHPQPNLRKLKELEAFVLKLKLEIDTSSSGQLHQSLESIKEKLKDDAVLFNIILSYATKPMQLASYFCTGDYKDNESDWGHYALAVPLYTHFTSPLRRYPDIIVHRTLAAILDAEELYLKQKRMPQATSGESSKRCFTGFHFDKNVAESVEGMGALSGAAWKHKLPNSELLAQVATHCNERKLACRKVKDACDKLYMWVLLKKRKVMLSEARILGLGPRFMSIYIEKLAIERRIYYDEVDGLMAEWLETTSTLVLSLFVNKRAIRRGSPGKWRPLQDVALVTNPFDFPVERSGSAEHDALEEHGAVSTHMDVDSSSKFVCGTDPIDPEVFPLTVRVLGTIPVALHAMGGDDGPLDVGVRLYMSSYLM